MPRKKYDLFQAEVALNTQLLGDAKQGKKEAALSEFKEKVSDVLKPEHEDYELHKWLKARNYDVDKAADMYRASMAYREKMKLDTLPDEYEIPEVLEKYLTGGFCGYDKEGSAIMVDMYGQLDMKGLMYSARKLDMEKTKLVRLERVVRNWKERCKKTGKQVDGMTVIADMEGAGTKMLWRPGMQMYLYLAKVLEDNYPEMMKRMFIVNAPAIFPLVYKLGRPLLSPETRNKINVLGSNFQETLLKYIDPEVLPMFLGGVRTDPDGNPRCASFLCQGGEVPKEYFLQDKENEDLLETVTVNRGDKLVLPYDVSKPGSVLRWEFKTDDFDIGFGVNLVLKGGKKEPVVPVERVNSHILPEDGSYTCDKAGTYEVVFDNSFSWARGKSVKYLVEVIDPVEDIVHTEIKEMLQRKPSADS